MRSNLGVVKGIGKQSARDDPRDLERFLRLLGLFTFTVGFGRIVRAARCATGNDVNKFPSTLVAGAGAPFASLGWDRIS
jgi:hypothetical protein